MYLADYQKHIRHDLGEALILMRADAVRVDILNTLPRAALACILQQKIPKAGKWIIG